MQRFIPLLSILTLLASLAQAQTATLRQQQVYPGDIAELTIEHESKFPSLYALDTTPLEADFKVLDTRSRIARVYRENRTVHRMQWQVQMVPRRSGRLRVPPLSFGGHYSEPVWLDVITANSELQARQKVFVEIEAQPENPYPGQQTRIVTRLLHNLQALDGALDDPEAGSAQIYRGSRDSRYRSQRDGDSLSVLERSILLIPAAADELEVSAASFRGSIAANGDSADSRYIYRQSTALRLPLRPLPPGYDSDSWLPARELKVRLDWDSPDAPARVGDSVGVTLTLEADGLPGEALPDGLLLRDSGAYRIYADKALRSTRVEGDARAARLLGRLQQRFAIIAQQPGELTLPRLQLRWWDVEQDRARVATLESSSLTVVGASAIADTRASSIEGAGTSSVVPRGLLPSFVHRHWPWIALLAGTALCAGLVYAAKPQRRRLRARLARARRRLHSLERLRQACAGDDAAAAHVALLAWARIHWRDHRICGLHAIAVRTGSDAWRHQLRQLDAAVFAPHKRDWRGRNLWQLVNAQGRTMKKPGAGRERHLPGLYPQRALEGLIAE